MEKTVYVFTGKDYIEIGVENFFQDPLIEAQTKDSVVDLYFATKVASDTIKDMMQMVKDKKVKPEVSDRFNPEFHEKIEKGREILEIMVRDFYGDEAKDVLNRVINSAVAESK